jgi:hypothetical protein
MPIVTRTYLLDGNVTAPLVERYLPAPLTSLKLTNLQTACVVEYDDATIDVADLDAGMSVFGYIPGSSSTVTVRSLADFPAPVGGVITLAEDTAYEVQGIIDITPNVLVMQDGTTLFGRSPATDQIRSHQPAAVVQVNGAPGSDTVAIIKSIQIVNGVGDCVDFQGDSFVSMVECGVAGASAGLIKDCKRFAFADSVMQSLAAGFRIEGASTSILFTRMFAYDLIAGCTLVTCVAPATAKLFHVGDGNIELNDATNVGLDLDDAIAGASDAAGVLSNLFIGPGTPLATGAGKVDPATAVNRPWRFWGNIGIADS